MCVICIFVYKVTIYNECLLDIVQNKYKKPDIFVYIIWNTLVSLECVKSTPEDSRSHISQCLLCKCKLVLQRCGRVRMTRIRMISAVIAWFRICILCMRMMC